jgi:AcrR family transcriptional regulator
MRKVGSVLGVEAMALYHYFRNKAELLDGILDIILADVAPDAGRNAAGPRAPDLRRTAYHRR